ncbi:hypothetical protein V8B55DRAFT_1515093 [Mucor lusitanicus]|uniref:Uncharacterized protein n=2 Tax=Mucor circinelloides f. lusitanicus TaxID=29924 RepID=A0A168KW75_MUCCL|nr:hypothetical protein FB192DRAFT_1400566 [Mucor lusitanicus]OAD02837.1 hypothetical protein MUCCIDRAFT_109683 [Mucor lusitanicus CBS 277.49]
MSENNLFQFAQVIAELPIQNSPQPSTSQPPPSHHPQQQHSDTIHNYNTRYLRIRKNACVVCSVCFTCSKYYGVDCTCPEVQPRRGKNLPEGGLDSRAKKLHRNDPDDFEFSINWINENAHTMYKDENDRVMGLRELSEVSLCKAHSSTLYRAKKRHERNKDMVHAAPPSPADSAANDHIQPSPYMNPYPLNQSIGSGGLAAKVREISSSSQYHHHPPPPHPSQHQPQMLRMHDVPDFTRLSHSTSMKRKRTFKHATKSPKMDSQPQQPQQQPHQQRPHHSVSTPLFTTSSSSRMNNFLQQHSFTPSTSTSNVPAMPQEFQQHVQQQQQIVHVPQQHVHVQPSQQHIQTPQMADNFPSQLPPLQTRSHHEPIDPLPTSSSSLHAQQQQQQQQQPASQAQVYPHDTIMTSPRPEEAVVPPPMVVETVSLRPLSTSSEAPSSYYFRNLAITDSFTFRDLLAEIDMTGSPPPGKRIVISDSEKFYPLDQAIRNVIRRPNSTHLELCLGLTDKVYLDWNAVSS